MTSPAKNCWQCAHRTKRFRGSASPRMWCAKYQVPATTRCADYNYKPRAIERVLTYLNRTSIK